MAYTELFYGQQPSWMDASRSSKYYTAPSRPTSMVFHVPLCCESCVEKVRKSLSKDEGIEAVDVDMSKSKVIVTGYLNPERVLRRIRRVKKSATFWDSSYDYSTQSPYSHTAEYDYTDPHVFDRNSSYSSSYYDDYTPRGLSPSPYDYPSRNGYYDYSRDTPNSYYSNGGRHRSSYDAYRYL